MVRRDAVPSLAGLATSLVLAVSGCGSTVLLDDAAEGGHGADDEDDGVGPAGNDASASTGSGACSPETFPCDGGRTCYGDGEYCDGVADCADGTDELECGQCGPAELECVTDFTCVSLEYECDRVFDCPEGEDEQGCYGCIDGLVALGCGGGYCVGPEQICDGVDDCPNGDDESFNACDGEVCDTGIEGIDLVLAYCLSWHCCTELTGCTDPSIDNCFACLDDGGGELCDSAMDCAVEAGCF